MRRQETEGGAAFLDREPRRLMQWPSQRPRLLGVGAGRTPVRRCRGTTRACLTRGVARERRRELGHFRRDCRPGLARRRIVAVLKVRGNHGAGLRFGAERLHLTRAFPPILGRRLPRHVDLSNPTDLAMTAMEAHGLRPVLAGLRPSRSAVATSPATLHLSLLRVWSGRSFSTQAARGRRLVTSRPA